MVAAPRNFLSGLPISAEVKETWPYSSTPAYAFMGCD
jgi:hypothetical protein